MLIVLGELVRGFQPKLSVLAFSWQISQSRSWTHWIWLTEAASMVFYLPLVFPSDSFSFVMMVSVHLFFSVWDCWSSEVSCVHAASGLRRWRYSLCPGLSRRWAVILQGRLSAVYFFLAMALVNLESLLRGICCAGSWELTLWIKFNRSIESVTRMCGWDAWWCNAWNWVRHLLLTYCILVSCKHF